MRFVGKVIWYIETNFRKGVGLDEIAAACGVSRFHMCRGFAAATGYPVIEYLRGRRLTEAARQLAATASRRAASRPPRDSRRPGLA